MGLFALELDAIANTVSGSDSATTTVSALTAATPVRVLAAKSDRTSFLVVNSSNANAFFGFTNAVSASVYVFAVPKNTYFEFNTFYPWTGEVWAIGSGNLNVTVTEITR